MRFLKKKIERVMAHGAPKKGKPLILSDAAPQILKSKAEPIKASSPSIHRKRVLGRLSASEDCLANKNIVKNYGRAICSQHVETGGFIP